MSIIEIPVPLATSDVRSLAEIAESKHCTVVEMIEEAVALLIAGENSRAALKAMD